jgi:hypothetical protein
VFVGKIEGRWIEKYFEAVFSLKCSKKDIEGMESFSYACISDTVGTACVVIGEMVNATCFVL